MMTSYTIEEARGIIAEKVSYENMMELVPLEECHDRILAQDIHSEVDVPGFKRSTMDGFAVCSDDLALATEESPVILTLVGRIEMGKEAPVSIRTGECAAIPTGGMLPQGADGILIIENAVQTTNGTVEAKSAVRRWDFIIHEDEDAAEGQLVLQKGKRIRPYEIGVLASIGCVMVPVFKKLKIGILVTGDEIVTPYEIPKPGQVRDINTYLMQGLIRSTDSIPVTYNIKSDNLEEIYKAAEKALAECDIVLVSGGSSVGVKDFTKAVFQKLPGSELLFHGLALKPGKPTLVSKCGSKLLFGMPGHPLSCAVVFNTLVRYYIQRINCVIDHERPVYCTLAEDFNKARGREEYVPVWLEQEDQDGRTLAHPISGKSGVISTFAKAYGYFRTDKSQDQVKRGDIVAVERI